MPIVPMPSKPTQGGPWLGAGDAWHTNIAQLIADVPALRADVTATANNLSGLQASKAPLNNPTFTGTVSGVTKAMVGLGNVDNTADAAKALSAAQVTSGTLPAARLPVEVAAIRRRTPTNEQSPTATNWDARPAGFGTVLAVGAPPAPSDQAATDLHIATTVATTAGTSFSGLADGAAWPSPWTVAKMPTGGSAVVQSGRGVLNTGNTVGNYESTDAVSVRAATQTANLEAVFLFRPVTSGAYPRFVARCDNATLDPANGVTISFNNGVLSASTVTGWAYTSIGSATKTWTVGTDYMVRLRLSGGTVQARSWTAGSAEPTSWDINGTTTQTASGYYGFWVGPGGTAQVRTVQFDDITIT